MSRYFAIGPSSWVGYSSPFRLDNYLNRNGELYPTHELGPIQFPVPVQIIVQPVMADDASFADFAAKIVAVTAFGMDQFAEQSEFDHVEDGQLLASVTAVFHEHAGHSGFFGGPHQFPALLDADCAAHFHADVKSGIHGVQCNLNVAGPAGRGQHCIQTFDVQQRAVILRGGGLGAAGFADGFGGGLRPVLIQIGYPDDIDVFHFQQQGKDPGSACAMTDEKNIDLRFRTLFHKQNFQAPLWFLLNVGKKSIPGTIHRHGLFANRIA